MGHVPARPLSGFRKSLDLSRRQYRRSRPAGNPDLGRLTTGEFGEILAWLYLNEQGLDVISRNVMVGGGEVDIVARDHAIPVVVEVRTLTGSYHPLDAIDENKRARVRRLAQLLGIRRCDLIGVGIHRDHYVVHWELNAF